MCEQFSLIDIVIPVHHKDIGILNHCIKSIIDYIPEHNNIYLITKTNILEKLNAETRQDCVKWFPEKEFPFSFDDVTRIITEKNRAGWYYQQLLKMYAIFIIPNITENILVVDSDNVFKKQIIFKNYQTGAYYYNFSGEYNKPYFTHIERLLPEIHKVYKDKSGICHHMIFQYEPMMDIFNRIEEKHQNKKFWQIFLECVDPKYYNKSGASEYEIFFNFMLLFYPERIEIRKLEWTMCKYTDMNKYKDKHCNLDYCTYYTWKNEINTI